MNTDLRIQDIVAKSSGVNLEHVVRVLMALVMVMDAVDEHVVAFALRRLLRESAKSGGKPAKLLSRPGEDEIEGCEEAYDLLWEKHGEYAMRNLKTLCTDPYYTPTRKRVMD